MKRYKRAKFCYKEQCYKINLYKTHNNEVVISFEGEWRYVIYNKNGKCWNLE